MTERRLVLVDANVLINFAHVNRLDLLGALTDLEFRAPSEVLSEILSEPGKTLVETCRSRGHLREMPFSTVAELTLFTELRAMMGVERPPASPWPSIMELCWLPMRNESSAAKPRRGWGQAASSIRQDSSC